MGDLSEIRCSLLQPATSDAIDGPLLFAEAALSTAEDAYEGAPLSAPEYDATRSIPDDIEECVVCLERPKSHVLIPCGHQCICETCQARLIPGNCPVCRKRCEIAVKVYK